MCEGSADEGLCALMRHWTEKPMVTPAPFPLGGGPTQIKLKKEKEEERLSSHDSSDLAGRTLGVVCPESGGKQRGGHSPPQLPGMS